MVDISDGTIYLGRQAASGERTRTDGSGKQSETNAVLVASIDGTIRDVNQAFLDLFETAESEALGSPLEQYLPSRDSVGTDTASAYRDGFSCDLTVETANGDSRSFMFQAVPFACADERRIVGVYVEDTERRREEARARLLTDLGREITEAETTLGALTQAVETICTYTEWRYGEVWMPAESGNHLTFTAGYSTDAQTAQFLAESRSVTFAFGAGLPGRVYETHQPEWIPDASEEPTAVFHRAELASKAGLRAAFGVPIVVDNTVVAVLSFFLGDRRGEDIRLASDIRAVVSNLEGLVKRKQAEEQLTRQNERLDAFTSTVTHDLRNPLSVAQGYLELATQEHTLEPLENVSNALDRMDTLIHNLLTLARDGKTIGEQVMVSVSDIATNAWQNVETQAAALDVQDGTLPADPIRTQQLFENLFRNSVEHGGDAVTVRVGPLYPVGTSTRTDGSGAAVGFYVEDDGPGISAEKRGSVFDGEYSTGGTGIGLVTVKEIASAHGWEHRCTASQDGGARFEFESISSTVDTERMQTGARHDRPKPIEQLPLPVIVEAVKRDQPRIVLHDEQVSETVVSTIESALANLPVEIRRNSTVSSQSAVPAELRVGKIVLATFSRDRLRKLASAVDDGQETGDGETAHALVNPVRSRDPTSMTAISREIEDRAHRVGGGTLYVGFQSTENFESQHRRYERLATTGVDVHTFGVSDWTGEETDRLTHHTESSRETARTWFVVYDGNGDSRHKSALVAVETEPDLFTGFWTDTPEIVDNLVASLVSRYDSLGG